MYDGNGALVSRFEYAAGRMPVAMETGGATYYLAYDQVGSLRAIVDTSGTVVREITYDSFGNILSETGSGPSVPFGFAGGLHDRDTGLVRFGARDYDPDVGRWTAKDPIGFAGNDSNLYAYVGDNPVRFTDPAGTGPGSFVLGKFGVEANVAQAALDAFVDSVTTFSLKLDPCESFGDCFSRCLQDSNIDFFGLGPGLGLDHAAELAIGAGGAAHELIAIESRIIALIRAQATLAEEVVTGAISQDEFRRTSARLFKRVKRLNARQIASGIGKGLAYAAAYDAGRYGTCAARCL